MKINLFGLEVEITVRYRFWEDDVVQRVNKIVPSTLGDGISLKIRRIKAIRGLSRLFPEGLRRNGVVSLSDAISFVEMHWHD